MINLLKNNKKLILFIVIMTILQVIATKQINAYYYYFFENDNFMSITSEEQVKHFNKIKELYMGRIEHKSMCDMILQTFFYKMKIITINSDVTKIILIPERYDNIGIFGTNLQGSYIIEYYFFNNELTQKEAEMVFNQILEHKYLKEICNPHIYLSKNYDIALRFNIRHYEWISFFKFWYAHKEIQNTEYVMQCWKNYTTFNVYNLYLIIIFKNLKYYYFLILTLTK